MLPSDILIPPSLPLSPHSISLLEREDVKRFATEFARASSFSDSFSLFTCLLFIAVMVSSYVSTCFTCCNRKSFRSISPPPPPRNSIPPTNAFNQNPFQITRNNTPYQSPNRTPLQNQDAATKGTILFHGSPAGPSGSTRGSKHYLEGSVGTLRRRMLSAPTLTTRKPFETPKILTGRKEKEKENERSEQDEEWYMVKKITPGERNRIPKDDADEPIYYDKNGNRISNYRRRTPRSLPVSRTTSAEDEDFKIERLEH